MCDLLVTLCRKWSSQEEAPEGRLQACYMCGPEPLNCVNTVSTVSWFCLRRHKLKLCTSDSTGVALFLGLLSGYLVHVAFLAVVALAAQVTALVEISRRQGEQQAHQVCQSHACPLPLPCSMGGPPPGAGGGGYDDRGDRGGGGGRGGGFGGGDRGRRSVCLALTYFLPLWPTLCLHCCCAVAVWQIMFHVRAGTIPAFCI